MNFAFVVDPLPKLKAYKDSSVAMMRAAAARGHQVHAIAPEALFWRGGTVAAATQTLTVSNDDANWYSAAAAVTRALADFDTVPMRQDPPFDIEYVAATWLLERAEAGGARVFNRPGAIRDHSEKLSIVEFPELIPETLVTRDAGQLNTFIDELGDVILKPLDGMGGSSIYRVRRDDPNRNVIIETLAEFGRRNVMVQRYLPEIAQGDKRILLIGGEVVPYCLARIPKAGESRGNLAAGGRGVVQPLSEADRRIAEKLAPLLAARGLLLVGIDVIGDRLTEINVTSPTCFVEISQASGFDVAGLFLDALERACS